MSTPGICANSNPASMASADPPYLSGIMGSAYMLVWQPKRQGA